MLLPEAELSSSSSASLLLESVLDRYERVPESGNISGMIMGGGVLFARHACSMVGRSESSSDMSSSWIRGQ